MKKFPIDGFLIALALAVAAAFVWPELGAKNGYLRLDLVTSYGLSVVFFLYGLNLAPERMRQGLGRWKVHLIVVLTTFVVFPIVVLALEKLVPGVFPLPVLIGFFYVAALPSTVSSAVAMTSMAHGNVPAAIFNATLSSLLGVFITPALMVWYLSNSPAESIPLLPTIGKVVLLVVLPIVVGQLLRPFALSFVKRWSHIVKYADRAIIVAIVYSTFCDSYLAGIWSRYDLQLIAEIIAGVLVLFWLVFGIAVLLCKLLRLDLADQIAASFCGVNKSLATGVPLAPLFFADQPEIGLIIVPLMMFHISQLVIISFLAGRYGRRAAAAAQA